MVCEASSLFKSPIIILSFIASIKTVADLVLAAPGELSKRLRRPLSEIQQLVQNVSNELAPRISTASTAVGPAHTWFTTGDAALDSIIGGGIRPGMVWEICGERYELPIP
jgi:DNA repair protein RAD57